MGVVRYAVECGGCRDKIVLRLGIGHEPRQPFFYVCGRCRAATKGVLTLDGGSNTTLELEDGQVLNSDTECSQTIHIDPDYPSVPGSGDLGQIGGSAFLFHAQLLGTERVVEFQHRTHTFEAFVKHGSPALRRLTTYYLNRDWRHFDVGLEPLVEGAPKMTKDAERHALIHELYEYAFLPFLGLGRPYYDRMRQEWEALWDTEGAYSDAMIQFAQAESSTERFSQLQRDLFQVLERCFELRRPIAVGLLIDQYPATAAQQREQLRLFRDDFVVLRDLYIQAFEQCHKGLRFTVGAANVNQRGSAGAFPAWPSPPHGRPPNPFTNLEQFSDLVAANKRIWVQLLPQWDAGWDEIFDRALRNDIGHASVRHRLSDGVLERNDKPPLPYLEFVRIAARVPSAILAGLCVLKTLLIQATRSPQPEVSH